MKKNSLFKIPIAFKISFLVELIICVALLLNMFLNMFNFDKCYGRVKDSANKYMLSDLKSNIEAGINMGFSINQLKNNQSIISGVESSNQSINFILLTDYRKKILYRSSKIDIDSVKFADKNFLKNLHKSCYIYADSLVNSYGKTEGYLYLAVSKIGDILVKKNFVRELLVTLVFVLFFTLFFLIIAIVMVTRSISVAFNDFSNIVSDILTTGRHKNSFVGSANRVIPDLSGFIVHTESLLSDMSKYSECRDFENE